jgi:DNA polymerase
MKLAVRRDLDAMQAGVRFREINDPRVGERFIAWFEPEHYIVERASRYFIDRFNSLDWTILTPMGSARWDRKELRTGPPAVLGEGGEASVFEIFWRPYEESVFNPSRTNEQVMRQLMPERYRREVLEGQGIRDAVQTAFPRVQEALDMEAEMPAKRVSSADLAIIARQEPKTLAELNKLIAASKPLVEGSDKAVLGEGPIHAAIAFVGEQPGDQEDLQGRPFVGPAGKMLDRAMKEAGINRKEVYVTNAVKHFKNEPRGRRRIHQRPDRYEIERCRWWLDQELDVIRPRLTVALGATAASALAGRAPTISKVRGRRMAFREGVDGLVTVHPSYILRLRDEAKAEAYRGLVTDLRLAARMLANPERQRPS